MDTHKPFIHLTDDNRGDYLPWEYPESLVEGLVVSDGIDTADRLVSRLLQWVARASERSEDVQYRLSRYDAAVILNLSAGWPDSTVAAHRGRPWSGTSHSR